MTDYLYEDLMQIILHKHEGEILDNAQARRITHVLMNRFTLKLLPDVDPYEGYDERPPHVVRKERKKDK